jgi:sugar phosphate permease
MKKIIKSNPYAFMAFVNIALASTFYLYEFFLRVTPGVLSYEIMHDLSINATMLGVISSCFYYGYIPMQIPAGILCDKYGPKNILTIAIGICSIFTIIFAYSNNITIAAGSRIVIGACSSVALIAPLAITSNWYDRKYFSFITGLIQLLGCIGAIGAGTPIAMLAKVIPWQYTIIWSGAVGLVITLLFILVIRDNPPGKKQEKAKYKGKSIELDNLKKILKNTQNWYTAIIAMACWAPIAVFSELWGVPFLMDLQKIDNTAAASEATIVWYGIAIGSPLAGWLSNKIRSRKIPIIACSIIGIISSTLLIYVDTNSSILIEVLLFCFGIAASSQPITFGLILDNNPKELIGTAIGFNNMAVISGAVLQALAGYIISLYWTGAFAHNAPSYGLYEFRHAFILIPIISSIGLIAAIFLVKETSCNKQYK